MEETGQSMSDRWMLRLGLAVLAFTLIVLHAGLLAGHSFFWGLPSLQFVPWRTLAFEQISQGILPLWNPLNGSGAPLMANYQSALFYPFSWLTFAATPWTMSVVAVLHLWLGGLGMARLTGRLGAPALGQILSAFAFGLTSYLVARLGTYPTITAAAWSPWLIWAVMGAIEDRRRSAGWLALFTALLLLAGHAQTAWYTLLLSALFAAYTLTRDRRWSVTRVLRLGGGLAVGLSAAMFQLAPTAELLMFSQRGDGVSFDFAMNFSYAPARILNLFAPNVFGTPADGSYFTEGAYFEDAVYVGMLPLISALMAIFRWLRPRKDDSSNQIRRQTLFWFGVLMAGIILAMGRYTPVFPFLYEHVPTFDLFQAPVRWHFWTVFALSVLAAFGTQYWLTVRRSPRTIRWTRRLTFAGIVGAAVCMLLSFTQPGSVAILARGIALASFFAALGGLLTLRGAGEVPHRRWVSAVVLVMALDLALANWGLNPTIDNTFYRPLDQPVIMRDSRMYMTEAEQDRLRFEEYLRFDDYRVAVDAAQAYRALLLPNMNLLDGVASLNNFDPLLFGPYAEYMSWVETAEIPARSRLLAAAGTDGNARAWVAASLCFVPDDSTRQAVFIAADRDLVAQPVAAGQGACPPPEDQPGSVISLAGDFSQVLLTVELESPGWLVLADADYPGWTARTGEVELPITRVNHLFRAVPLDSGMHTVRFAYQPTWLLPAAVVSAVAWLMIVVIFRVRLKSSA